MDELDAIDAQFEIEELVGANTRDELMELADSEGATYSSRGNKPQIAREIVEHRATTRAAEREELDRIAKVMADGVADEEAYVQQPVDPVVESGDEATPRAVEFDGDADTVKVDVNPESDEVSDVVTVTAEDDSATIKLRPGQVGVVKFPGTDEIEGFTLGDVSTLSDEEVETIMDAATEIVLPDAAVQQPVDPTVESTGGLIVPADIAEALLADVAVGDAMQVVSDAVAAHKLASHGGCVHAPVERAAKSAAKAALAALVNARAAR